MLTENTFDVSVMLASFLVLIGAYLLIVWKDRSWLNWATPVLFFMLGGRYFFQMAYVYLMGASGSHYAYVYCYTTYALTFLTSALVYAFLKPLQFKSSRGSNADVDLLPWIILAVGFLLYLPVLIQFRQYLTNPRRIYELTRTGYGLWYFGSAICTTLAFIVYLFRKNKHILGTVIFCILCAALTYWHGSKGQIVTFALIYMQYFVYVKRKRVRAFAAATTFVIASVLVLGLFAFFSTSSDIAELLTSVTTYADYVRNAMSVIDDPNGKIYYGRLSVETEFYSRVPRLLMPDKPKDFGAFLLAKTYNPASYRSDEGASAFDIGVQYADFGPFAILVLCLTSGLTTWILSSLVSHLRRRPSAGVFLVFLFLLGISVIPLSGFYLPETMIIACGLSVAQRFRLMRGGLGLHRTELTAS